MEYLTTQPLLIDQERFLFAFQCIVLHCLCNLLSMHCIALAKHNLVYFKCILKTNEKKYL